jgi:hypothetical protein
VPAISHHWALDVEPLGRRAASEFASTSPETTGSTSTVVEVVGSMWAQKPAGTGAMFVAHGATA